MVNFCLRNFSFKLSLTVNGKDNLNCVHNRGVTMDYIQVIQDILYFILKILIIILLVAITFLIGAMLGYSIFGDGGNPLEVLNPQLWEHIFDFFIT